MIKNSRGLELFGLVSGFKKDLGVRPKAQNFDTSDSGIFLALRPQPKIIN